MTMKMNQVPKQFQVTPIHSKDYLVNGEIKSWKGPSSEVFSTIQTENESGEMAPTFLGTIPDMESETALEALEAANKAFDRGKGLWPTMKVKERLTCLEKICR